MNTSSPVGAVADKFDRFEVVLARRAVLRQKILRRQFVDKTPALNKHVANLVHKQETVTYEKYTHCSDRKIHPKSQTQGRI